MKEKMYSFIAHPVNDSRTGEYIEHSITEQPAITLYDMLESYARFLSAIGYDLDGRELMIVDTDEVDEVLGSSMSFDPHYTDAIWKDGLDLNDI